MIQLLLAIKSEPNTVESLKILFSKLTTLSELDANRIAVVHKNVKLSYGSLYQDANQIAKLLKDSGFEHQRIVVMMPLTYTGVVLMLALIIAKCCVVPININPGNEYLENMLTSIKPALIICCKSLHDYFFKSHQGKKCRLITVNEINALAHLEKQIKSNALKPFDKKHDLPPFDYEACIFFTSGSTGEPKGLIRTYEVFLKNLAKEQTMLNYTHEDCLLLVTPLSDFTNHSMQLMTGLLSRSTLKLIEQPLWDFSQKEVVMVKEAFTSKPPVTSTMMSPASARFVLETLSTLPKAMFTHIKDHLSSFIVLGSRLSKDLYEKFIGTLSIKLTNVYGASEGGALAVSTSFNEHKQSIFLPLQAVQAIIRTNEGAEVTAHEIGTLWVKHDMFANAYIDGKAIPLTEGWYNTKDLGYMTPSQELILTGRTRTTINFDGDELHPKFIEAASKQPFIQTSCITGVDNTFFGEVFALFFTSNRPISLPDDMLTILSSIDLELFKHAFPRIILLDKLPPTTRGKISHALLKNSFATIEDSIHDKTQHESIFITIKTDEDGAWIKDSEYRMHHDELDRMLSTKLCAQSASQPSSQTPLNLETDEEMSNKQRQARKNDPSAPKAAC